ncbi:undecaprenyl/decaprenyl-phosphate alpha-N-acetylglucosaminyl 1-phosphate transferase [Streptomyces sp. NWU49]|uniref:Undecaprenyl/decaprenyl-phosphate alpha-N-acetylglucosaminyl 1-phosphate transferase n=1 Tax=Streptomyces viridosporus T7A TaxID=665577 RepID=A0ABX6AIG0_STRVD|nr:MULTISPECIES: MraY family glycosyltransferase [Streptomyces]PWJ07780.1 undecaprenyl/decaprenyl-phosphate alpha-N-acetylglucosaminyl 1-phosphate transferase [Streptomyces sp. NWU49]QEU86852.1 undecaprenyl/decaprenyl-phosphate alpha-N-acetylglucosaminyl 1-phosphate transferase [Streptomyces viridosporus T7A]
MLYGIAAATTALLLAALLTELLRPPALRLGLLDRRRRRAVPLSGGAAVASATVLVAAAGDATGVAPLGAGIGTLLVAGACVGALGLAVDVWRLKWWVPLAGTTAAAAVVVPFEETGVPGGLLAVGWVAGLTAAFRGLDHADGLAGTVGVVTAFGAAVCAAAELMDGIMVLLSVLAAALAGFLVHNRHPARAGLGACGSLFTGFVLASAVVFVRAGHGMGASAGVLFALTAVACADVALVVLARWPARRPLACGGPDHLGHRLRRLGVAPRAVTVLLGTGALGGVVAGVCAHTGWASGGVVLWAAAVAVVVVLALARVSVTPVLPPRQRSSTASVQVSQRLRVENR